MELKEAMLKRRSVRKFTAQPVPEELIESAIDYLDGREMEILNSFEKRFPSK